MSSNQENMSSDQEQTTNKKDQKKYVKRFAKVYESDSFDVENHFYQKAINAQMNSIVANFMALGNDRILSRYCHLNPKVDAKKLKELLCYKPAYFRWSGCDLFNVTTQSGNRNMVLIETNSCPSGQKSMPSLAENDEFGGYKVLIERTFKVFQKL